MDIIKILKNRYSTKEFDNTKSLSNKQMEQIQDILQLAPSSTNLQPWYFIIASSDEGKKLVAKATEGLYSKNTQKILDSCVTIIFASKTQLDDQYLTMLINKENDDQRFLNDQLMKEAYLSRKNFTEMHKTEKNDFLEWSKNQLFINLGNFLLGVASIGLDSICIEGIDLEQLDNMFLLNEIGYSSCCIVCVGYRKENEANSLLPKSRLEKEDIIKII